MERGTIIGGRYQLVDPVAEGGLATLWQGVDRDTEAPVAIKVMKREFATVGGHYLDTFTDEARIGAQLDHPNLVHVRDFVVEHVPYGNAYCQVMEWIDGLDMRTLIQVEHQAGRPLPWELVAGIGISVLHGLSAAHERKLAGGILSPVIHRDVAPQNILLGTDGVVKLGDFGMARARDRIAEHTAPGIVKGTLSYVAPECLKGDAPGARSDLYSLGVTMWEAMAGDRMFKVASQVKLINKIRNGEIQPIVEVRADIPPAFAAAIHRSLATEKGERFANANAMAAELASQLESVGVTDTTDLVAEAVNQALATRDAAPPSQTE